MVESLVTFFLYIIYFEISFNFIIKIKRKIEDKYNILTYNQMLKQQNLLFNISICIIEKKKQHDL